MKSRKGRRSGSRTGSGTGTWQVPGYCDYTALICLTFGYLKARFNRLCFEKR